MAPENANIFLVEDDESSLSSGKLVLEIMGNHNVVETASTLEEAFKKIPYLSEKGINVAVVDGSLSESSSGTYDGEMVVDEIKKRHPGIKVVGHAGTKFIRNADINCTKIEGPERLVEAVTKI